MSEKELIICPKCNIEIPPTKSPSIAGVILLSGIYVIYYYLFKNRHCPICFHLFSKEELQSYKEPDSGWQLLSVALLLLYILGIFALIFGG